MQALGTERASSATAFDCRSSTSRFSNREGDPHETHCLKLDTSKARARLGWRPRISLDEAVAMTAQWYRAYYAGAGSDALIELTMTQIEQAMV